MGTEIMKINDENCEVYLFRYREGELDADERAMVERALEERPDWRELADLYDPELRLTVDTSVVFPHKDRLLFGREEVAEIGTTPAGSPKGKRVPLWTKVSAVASVVLLLCVGIGVAELREPGTDSPLTAKNSPLSESAVLPAPTTPTTERPVAPEVDMTVQQSDRRPAIRPTASPADRQATSSVVLPAESLVVQMSDQLITYLDDSVGGSVADESLLPARQQPDILMTDRLITYLDEEAAPPPQPERRPGWQYAMEDWINGIRLARVEFETSVVTRLTDMTLAENNNYAKNDKQ